MYAASCHVDGVDEVMEIVANAVLRPNITDEEVNCQHFLQCTTPNISV